MLCLVMRFEEDGSSEDYQPVPVNGTNYEASFTFDDSPTDIIYVVWSYITYPERGMVC